MSPVTPDQVRTMIEKLCFRDGCLHTIRYNELASALALPPVDEHWKTHPLCSLFGLIDREDIEKEQPFITACVVNETGRSGFGFYKMCYERIGMSGSVDDEADQKRLHALEMASLAEYYKLRLTDL